MQTDVLIIGNGIAALTAAICLPKDKNILLITKATGMGCNSHWAQGGVAAPNGIEDIPLHIKDTLEAGAGACDKNAVEVLISRGYEAIKWLIDLGMPFDKDSSEEVLYTKEAAHSTNRILHAGGDATGQKIHTFLSTQNNHPILTGAIVVDLLIENGKCYGATIVQNDKRFNIYANETIIATGGFGGLYKISTNAPGMMGELQGIALSKGCMLKDMHFTQFHPTVFTGTDALQKPLLTEALRGEGAKVVDENGEEFLIRYDKRRELAPRDVVSRAIFDHLSHDHKVFLDLSHFEANYFAARFPTVTNRLREFGFNPPADKVPISPAFHYAMGGIATDTNGQVLGTKGLYAIGEVARTGVHGANRLASNSLLEAIVFGRLSAQNITQNPNHNEQKEFATTDQKLVGADDAQAITAIREILWNLVGIVRTKDGLKSAEKELAKLESLDLGLLVQNSLITAKEIANQANKEPRSIGAHFLKER